ncbi:MAG TPA: hypothetical protein VGO55_14590 [Allosphingosinicella sp.]|nr:hypothetical protein [Allosphingosinicella sp.]
MHDPAYAILRAICGALAIFAAITLVDALVTGRWWSRRLVPDRAQDALGYCLTSAARPA